MITDLGQGCVTVSRRVRGESRARAENLASRLRLPFVTSPKLAPLPRLVVERSGIHLETGQAVIRSHPGMGLVRVRRLVRGDERDPLIDHAQVRPGDRVLDGTFGFGQDALVLASALGPEGELVGVEASALLAGLAIEGMRHWPEPGAELMARAKLHLGQLRDYLEQQPDRSFDVVYLDPMFRRPRSAAPDFAVLRSLAEMAPLDEETFRHALRVARRVVLMKDAWPGHEIVRLGREPEDVERRSDVVYGVWQVAPG